MDQAATEWFVRRSVFAWLDGLVVLFGEVLPSSALREGAPVGGARVRVMGLLEERYERFRAAG